MDESIYVILLEMCTCFMVSYLGLLMGLFLFYSLYCPHQRILLSNLLMDHTVNYKLNNKFLNIKTYLSFPFNELENHG